MAPGTGTRHSLHELSGGARVLAAPMADRASASLVLMFGIGSRFESDALGGAAHFIEHLLFKGTSRRPTAKAIAEAIEGVGGMMNASTDKEVTAYWARVPADRIELAIDVLSDIVSDPRFEPADVERERMVILEELKMYQDQPQDYVHSLFEEIMWPGHPLGRDIGGTAASVSDLSRETLLDHLHANYRRPRLVVGISGAIDSDRVVAQLDSAVALHASREPDEAAAAPPPLDAPRALLHDKRTEQAHVCLGSRAISYLDPDRYALDLVNTILGEGMSSRLFLEIREQRGLAYDVHSFTSKHVDAGYFGIYMGVDPSKAEEAVKAAVAELRRISREPVGDAELTKAKEFMKGRLRLGLESTNATASWLAQQVLLTGRVREVEEIVGEIERLTAEDVTRAAARVFDQPLQLAVIGPFKSESPFLSAISV